jgi:hypothetical protein
MMIGEIIAKPKMEKNVPKATAKFSSQYLVRRLTVRDVPVSAKIRAEISHTPRSTSKPF